MDYDSEYYENLLNKVPNYEDIKKCLDITEEFIIRKGLIMTGGTAIDMALRIKGGKLYSDTKQMDYDVYTSENVNDAYELGSILCKNGFNNISCINAFHMGTMTVRVDFVTVADFTYCPIAILKRMPTLRYHKFIIVHPHWQMIDQHSALSFPYNNPGKEVIFQRWEKDMKRYDMLYRYYPVVPTIIENIKSPKYIIGGRIVERRTLKRERMAKKLLIPITTIRIDITMLSNTVISGWASVSYKINGNIVTICLPKGEPISLASHDYKSYIAENKLTIKSFHCKYAGKLPQNVRCYSDIKDSDGDVVDIEIFDIYGLLLSAKKINDEYNIWVCCVQWSMLYLMIKIFSSDDKRVVFTAEELYVECRRMVIEGNCPSAIVCGTRNYSRDFICSLNKSKAFIYSIRRENTRPNNRYPILPLCEITERFDPSIDNDDGKKVDSLIEYNIDPYPEYTISTVKHVH